LFLGQYRYSFDDQNRLSMPAAFREPGTAGAFVTQGFDRNLLVLSTSAFEDVYRRVLAMNLTDPLARLLHRMLLGSAAPLDADEAGRFTLPPALREYAALDGDVVLVGLGDYFEIWSPALWGEQEAALHDAATNARRFAVLNLSRG